MPDIEAEARQTRRHALMQCFRRAAAFTLRHFETFLSKRSGRGSWGKKASASARARKRAAQQRKAKQAKTHQGGGVYGYEPSRPGERPKPR